MKSITLRFYKKESFVFHVSVESEAIVEGCFEWNGAIKKRMIELEKLIEEENEFWYLDDKGDRLNDQALFEASPWSIEDKNQKIVCRFLNFETGEAKFSVVSWVTLGDYL